MRQFSLLRVMLAMVWLGCAFGFLRAMIVVPGGHSWLLLLGLSVFNFCLAAGTLFRSLLVGVLAAIVWWFVTFTVLNRLYTVTLISPPAATEHQLRTSSQLQSPCWVR